MYIILLIVCHSIKEKNVNKVKVLLLLGIELEIFGITVRCAVCSLLYSMSMDKKICIFLLVYLIIYFKHIKIKWIFFCYLRILLVITTLVWNRNYDSPSCRIFFFVRYKRNDCPSFYTYAINKVIEWTRSSMFSFRHGETLDFISCSFFILCFLQLCSIVLPQFSWGAIRSRTRQPYKKANSV